MVVVVVVVQVIVVLVVVRESALRRVGEQRVVVVVAAATINVAAHATAAVAAAARRVEVAAIVEHADGSVLADAVRHLERVHPERQLVGQELAQTSFLQTASAARLGQDRVHLVVDSDAAVAGALRRLLGKPMVLVVVPQQVL